MNTLYERIGLKVTAETRPAFSGATITAGPRKLASGNLNKVYAVTLKLLDGSGTVEKAFKPLLATEQGAAARTSGTPESNPQTAMRNLATENYSKKLGFDVIVPTRVTVLHLDKNPSPGDAGTLGLIMDIAPGKPADVAAKRLSNKEIRLAWPALARELTKLQLLDQLTAQGDRDAKNYFVETDGKGGAKITGIDNDQCFGKLATDPKAVGRQSYGDSVFRGVALPAIVDSKMAGAIEAITPEHLDEMFKGKLTTNEIFAAKRRLTVVKQHISSKACMKISPSDWGHPFVLHQLNSGNSYLRRDFGEALDKALQDE